MGCTLGGDAFCVRGCQYLFNRGVDSPCLLASLHGIVTIYFLRDVYQSPGVNNVVNRICDSKIMKFFPVPLVIELIICTTGDDLACEALNSSVINDSTQSTRRKDIARNIVERARLYNFNAKPSVRFLSDLGTNVTANHHSAFQQQKLRQVHPDIA